MQSTSLKSLMQKGLAERLDLISEGLLLLVEHVEELSGDAEALQKTGRKRGVWILADQADEEAAKVLILLDLLRMDPGDSAGLAQQLGRFHQHLARRIYVEVAEMTPADFGEVRRIVEMLRPSHYLDGPNDVDWIFPNRLLSDREQRLYVDLDWEDGRARWTTPADDDELRFGGPCPTVRELVMSMYRIGLMTPDGLRLVSEIWADAELDDETHWRTLFDLNREAVIAVLDAGLDSDDVTQTDIDRVAQRWGFPLGGLDLSQLKVPPEELREEQERWAPF